MADQNTAIVQKAYEAFKRGEINGILELLSDDVSWEPIIGAGPHVPHAGKRQGKAAVRQFFETLGNTFVFERFEPREFVAQGDVVVALGHYQGRPKTTGRAIETDWAMVFRIKDGRITEFREFTDSAALNAAYATG